MSSELVSGFFEVKGKLGHGEFLPWIDFEFGMDKRTAQRFMGVATSYGSKYDTVSHLNPSALYALGIRHRRCAGRGRALPRRRRVVQCRRHQAVARMADDDSLRVLADRIQARAVRRMGELLKQFPAMPGARTDKPRGRPPEVTVGSVSRRWAF